MARGPISVNLPHKVEILIDWPFSFVQEYFWLWKICY